MIPAALAHPFALRAAQAPPQRRDEGRLLVVTPADGAFDDAALVDLPERLAPGDVLVLNDAATLPASLTARVHGEGLEVRLLAQQTPTRWRVVLFGGGDWHVPTEHRPPPPRVALGDVVQLGTARAGPPSEGRGAALHGRVVDVSRISPRLVDLELEEQGGRFWEALYAHGAPVQYSHQREALDLWSVQTSYAGRPWAVEMPSAGRPLSFRVLAALRRRGVVLATLTHAAGLSATGDPLLDRALPLGERYELPQRTLDVIHAARARGGRVIAAGTSVVRALEGGALHGPLVAGGGATELRIDGAHTLHIVDGLLSGMHVPGESHFELLCAFASSSLWERALQHARDAGYRAHEFGDSTLVFADRGRDVALARLRPHR